MTSLRGKSETGSDFWENADVLRGVLIRSVIYLIIAFLVSFILLPSIFDTVILGPCRGDFITYRMLNKVSFMGPVLSADKFPIELVNIRLGTQFFVHIQVALSLAFIAVLPLFLAEAWHFLRPALYQGEAAELRFTLLWLPALFYLGVLVGYYLVFPLTLQFLVFYDLSDLIENQVSLESYMSNFITLLASMGLIFLLPLAIKALAGLGILHKENLKRGRQYAVVVLLVLAAIITPSGDPFTMTVVFTPLYLLYEVSLLFVSIKPKQN